MAAGIIVYCFENSLRELVLPQAVFVSAGDKGEDFLRKRDDDAAGHSQHAVGALGGVVALKGQADLQDTETQ